MGQTDYWKRLIEDLDAWTSASETEPGRIEVSVPQGAVSRRVVIVMTPDEWDETVGVVWGVFDDAVEDVKRTLLSLRPHEGFAVYGGEYRLEPSTDPTLPEPAEFTPEPGGEWVAYDQEGRVASRLADWSEPDGDR